MLRIVQVGAYPLSSEVIRGGVEASVYGLAQELGQTCEVHVFDIPRQSGTEGVAEDGSVLVHRVNNPGRWQISAIRQARKMTEEIIALQPDVCHIHGTGTFSWQMYKSLKKKGIHCVVTIHGLAKIEKRKALRKKKSLKSLFQFLYQGWSEKKFLGQLSLAIVDTDYVSSTVAQYPIRRIPIMQVIPQGISDSFFSIDCSRKSNIILSVGAIGTRKGHLLTLRAFEMLRGKCDAKLVIAGVVAEQSYLEKLQIAISNSKYKESISLYVNLAKEELMQLYTKAHLFALHSEEESQGIVFAEAMATGLPIVSTRVGGVPYVVSHGVNGLLSDYGDVVSFEENMRCLITDGDKWQSMSEASKNESVKYHWGSICERIQQLYLSV